MRQTIESLNKRIAKLKLLLKVHRIESAGKRPQTKIYYSHENIHIGNYSYGYPNIQTFDGSFHCYIGKFCSIGENVRIIVDEHRKDWISTFPFGYVVEGIPKNQRASGSKGDVKIGNDVWIGHNVVVLSGVTIGSGAVVGAGSIVTKDVSDYEIVAGNPAKHIRYRFTKEEIQALLGIRWWDWPISKIRESADLLESPNISDFIAKLTPS